VRTRLDIYVLINIDTFYMNQKVESITRYVY